MHTSLLQEHISNFVDGQLQRIVSELGTFISYPSVSADTKYIHDIHRCAQWLATHLQHIGLDNVSIIPSEGNPVVYAHWFHAPNAPTLLIYGHYDVQPAGILSEWKTPPFSPVIRNGHIIGRGVSDDKGQLFCHLKAIEFFLKTYKKLPVNIICMFDGDEEIGSPYLRSWMKTHQRKLNAHSAIISDTRMAGRNTPAITYSLRGGVSIKLEVAVSDRDVHGGHYGGMIYHPVQILCEVISKFHTRDGSISIPGVYDDVIKLHSHERSFMATQGPSDTTMLRNAGTHIRYGEPGFTNYERVTIRPSLTIQGITTGNGNCVPKGDIPARASATFSFHLVPKQSPRTIVELFINELKTIIPEGVEWKVEVTPPTLPVVINRSESSVQAASRACKRVFQKEPVFLRSGGGIPAASFIQEILHAPVVLMGFALPDSNIHSANERLHLPTFSKGIQTCIWFLEELGRE